MQNDRAVLQTHGLKYFEMKKNSFAIGYTMAYLGLSPCPVTVTTTVIQFLVGNPYKPSFVTVTGRRGQPKVYLFLCGCVYTLFDQAPFHDLFAMFCMASFY